MEMSVSPGDSILVNARTTRVIPYIPPKPGRESSSIMQELNFAVRFSYVKICL